MITDKIKELAATQAKVAKLKESIAADLRRELASLPNKYGFESTNAFLAAVRSAAKGSRGKRGAKRSRKRAKITDATRAEVKKLTEAGKTGKEIAKAVGVSLPSVQNIKKALGLVQKRKKG